MTSEIAEMEAELERYIRIRDVSVGVAEKRVNYKIAELQSRIDHAKAIMRKVNNDEYE